MKVLAMQGSPNLGGNTAALLDAWLEGAQEGGAQIERLNVTQLNITPCLGCNFCRPQGKATGVCVHKDQMPYHSLAQADILVLASPVYWWSFTAQLKAFVDRMYALPFNIWRHKKVKHIFTMHHPAPSMAAQSFELVWNYMSSYMHFKYLGALEGSCEKALLSQQPELLEKARGDGLNALTA